jgi:hypothetical protein
MIDATVEQSQMVIKIILLPFFCAFLFCTFIVFLPKQP